VGPYVDVVAPGDEVLAAAPGRGHQKVQGTSYAAPFVSATAALIRQYRPELSAAQVVDRIVATADPAPGGGHNDAYGNGVLNPYRAVTETGAAARSEPTETVPAGRADPAVAAREDRRAAAREKAWWVAGVAGGLAGVVMLLAVVLPSGARRRWRPAGLG
jgi:subtilisin family serine protease